MILIGKHYFVFFAGHAIAC